MVVCLEGNTGAGSSVNKGLDLYLEGCKFSIYRIIIGPYVIISIVSALQILSEQSEQNASMNLGEAV